MARRTTVKRYAFWAAAAVAVAIIAALALTFWSSHSSRHRVDELLGRADARTMEELPLHATRTKAQLLELYDIECREERSSWVNDALKSITRGHLRLYQPTYARLKIVQAGREAVLQPLLDIACDEAGSFSTRFWALNILLYFNDHRVLDAWVKYAEANPQCSPFFEFLLPLSEGSPYCATQTGAAALKRDMQGKTYEEFVLGLLDVRVKDKDLYSDDTLILRCLNRFCEYDVDKWLKASAPEAFEFRNAELRKGYEPIELYHDLFSRYRRKASKTFDEGTLANLLPGSFDRMCCQQLLKCYYSVPRKFPETSDWQPRLVEWYTSARPYLKYDTEFGRFVNTAPDAVSK